MQSMLRSVHDRMPSRWYAPDLAATAVGCVTVIAFYFADVADPDFFWHLKAGEWIAAHHALPVTDPFLQTQGDTAWVLHEWLFELLLFGVYRTLGNPGVRLLVAGLQTASVIVLLRAFRKGLSGLGPLLLALLCAAAIIPYASPRPHLATILLTAVFGSILQGYAFGGRSRQLMWLPLLMVPWVNMHGGYVVGIALVAVVALSVGLRVPRGPPPGSSGSPRWLPLLLCLAGCILAAGVNPYGFAHFLFPVRVLTMWMGPFIDEWRPFNVGSPAFGPFLIALAVFTLAQIYRARKPGPVDLSAPGAITLLAISAGRHAPLATMVVALFAAPALRDGAFEGFRRAWGAKVPGLGGLRGAGRATAQLGATEHLLNALLIALVVGLAAITLRAQEARRMASANAVIGWRAIDTLARSGFEGRCLNEYGFGGYFTFRLWPRNKAFIDGRPDMYPDAFAREYAEMIAGSERWRAAFDRHRFDCVVIPRRAPLRQLIVERGGYEEVYADADNVIMIRSDHAAVSRVREAAAARE